eukprot:3602964-Rhodomonas_salina.1
MICAEQEEVKDTLRWGDDSAKSKKIKPKKGKAKAELEPPPPPVATMRRNEEEIVMAGRGGDQDVDEESVFDSEEDESELPEDELKRCVFAAPTCIFARHVVSASERT